MALRSALRKMPALGLSSVRIAPRMGAVSPAAASRHLSEANFPCTTGGKQLDTCGQGPIDSSPDSMIRMIAEYNKERAELNKHLAECDKMMAKIRQQRAEFPEHIRCTYESIRVRVNRRVNIFVAAHCGASALLVIGTMYRHSSNCY